MAVLWLGSNVVQPVHIVPTLMPRRQIYMATLLQRQIVVSTPSRPQMLQWQHYYHVEIATANSQSRYYDVAPTLRHFA